VYNVHSDKWYRIIGTLGGANTVYRVQLYIEANKHSQREASRRRNRIGSKQSVTVMETWSSREPFQYGRTHTHTHCLGRTLSMVLAPASTTLLPAFFILSMKLMIYVLEKKDRGRDGDY
jgi:hypothetical protein